MRDAYVIILMSVITLGAGIGLSLPMMTLLPGIAGLVIAAAIVRVGSRVEKDVDATVFAGTKNHLVHSAA